MKGKKSFMDSIKDLFWKYFWIIKAGCKDEVKATTRDISLRDFDRISTDIIEKLSLQHDDRVLDVGCAGGMFDVKISRQVLKLTATDKFPSMINRAEENTHKFDNIELILCDPYKVPKPDRSYSKILCYSVLHCISSSAEILKILKEFNRLLDDNGSILLGDIPDPSLEKKKGPPFKNNSFSKIKNAIYLIFAIWHEKEDLLNHCRSAGFKADILEQSEDLPFHQTRYDLILTKQK